MAAKLCRACDGRGFHWKESQIVSRVDGSIIADMKKQGETCSECRGDGKSREISGLAWAFIIGLFVFLFILYNIPAVPV